MRNCLTILLPFLALSGVMGCSSSHRGRIVTQNETHAVLTWTAAEREQPIAVRPLRKTSETSISLIRLAASEKPHIHRNHDLIVVLLAGAARLHVGERTVDVRPGDVMEIPRGVTHWAENVGDDASEVYAIFSPPYDGLDNIPVLPFTPPTP